jgi:hypothetical protein
MRATFRIEDERLGVNAPEASLTAGRPLGSGDIEAFGAWAATYQSLREKTGAEGQLIDLGRALYRWLDGNERWLDALLPAADPLLIFEFQALGTTGAAAKAFLQAPWELLAEPDGGFLAGDAIRLYCPLRRLGRAVEPAPAGRPVPGLVFMAAAPRNVLPVLDYEKEETAGLLRRTETARRPATCSAWRSPTRGGCNCRKLRRSRRS